MGAIRKLESKHYIDNEAIADNLEEIADILEQQKANPFRISAYIKAAKFVRAFKGSVAKYVQKYGPDKLAKFPTIGKSLAKTIYTLGRGRKLGYLQKLRGEAEPESVLSRIPTIGPKLADLLHNKYHIDSVYDLERVVKKGKLKYFEGIGPKRERAIREFFENNFNAKIRNAQASVGSLLEIDRQFITKTSAEAASKETKVIDSNEGPRWQFEERGTNYTVMYSKSKRARQLGKDMDWVLIIGDGQHQNSQWTIITAQYGKLAGKRIVLGREDECEVFYNNAGQSE